MLLKNTISCCTFFVVFVLLLQVGCVRRATPTIQPPETTIDLHAQLDILVGELLTKQRHFLTEIVPVAVVSGSLKRDGQASRLEELVVEKLTARFIQQQEVRTLSSQNWFEFKAGHPLSSVPEGLLVYEVMVTEDDLSKSIRVAISSHPSIDTRKIHSMVETTFECIAGSLAVQLFTAPSRNTLLPEGVEDRPYGSIDRLSFHLISELADRFQRGVWVEGQPVAKSEIRILLRPEVDSQVSAHFATKIITALQQAIIRQTDFPCVVMDSSLSPVQPTLVISTQISRSLDGNKVRVALQAVWHHGPLIAEDGGMIVEDLSGTYLSRFSAQGWLMARDRDAMVAKDQAIKRKQTQLPSVTTICFYDFPAEYRRGAQSVLQHELQVVELSSADDRCQSDTDCFCLQFYSISRQTAVDGLKRYWRLPEMTTFLYKQSEGNRLDLYFDAGFN